MATETSANSNTGEIPRPDSGDVSEQDRAELGVAWLAERSRMLDEGYGSLGPVRALVDGS